MKKISAATFVAWIVLPVVGMLVVILGGVFGIPRRWLQWMIAAVMWCGTGFWVALRLARRTRRRSPQAATFSGNQSVFNRIMRETREAARRYMGSVRRKGLLEKSALHERPWFLLCGPGKSGKSSLLKGSGINFPLTYPSERDGIVVEGSNQVCWNFADNAVWIDTPGSYMEESGREEWQAFIASLEKTRPEQPIDGIALVLNAQDVLNATDQEIRDIARLLRSRIDDCIALWGIEFPVYLLFNHTDKIPGFADYFGAKGTEIRNQILGATLSNEQRTGVPRLVFAEEYTLLCRSLTDLRVDKLLDEKDGTRKRMVCRFVIHFEGIQEKLGRVVAELFKPSNYEGKPLFSGFYFTSCRSTAREEPAAAAEPDMSMTIADHPLNPKRMVASKTPAQSSSAKSAVAVSSLFVLPLFHEIMVKGSGLVTRTQRRSRKELVRHHLIALGIVLLAAAIGSYFVSVRLRFDKRMKAVEADLSGIAAQGSSLSHRYEMLDIMRRNMERLHRFEKTSRLGMGLDRGKPVLDEWKKTYFEQTRQLVTLPAVKYLEYAIWTGVQSYGDLAGEAYQTLYTNLKTYLSISEAVSGRPQDIDTTLLRPVLQEAVTRALLAQSKETRLPQQVETILGDNIGWYLLYLKRQEFHRIQENQRLVAQARARLQRLPDAQTIYQTVVARLTEQAPTMSIDDILSRSGEGILKSERGINAIYTQNGYEQYVNDALSEASRNPYTIDWVLGITKDQIPESMPDGRKLKSEMIDAYFRDFKVQWISFLSSIRMEPFGDIARCSRMLQNIGQQNSEIAALLEAVSASTVIKPKGELDEVADEAMKAKQLLGTKSKIGSQIEKGRRASEKVMTVLPFGKKTPENEINATFEPLRQFVRSGSVLSGLQGYRDKLLTLAEKMASIETRGEEHATIVFTGREDDPLLSGWKYCQSELTGLPSELADALRTVLMSPLKYASDAAGLTLTSALNTRWRSEIVKPFSSRLSGRYPFVSKGEEASFTAVMEFFRPTTGTFWGFHDRVLSPYVSKSASGWMVRSIGGLSLQFNPDLAKSLSAAERIREMFFRADGTFRPMAITISPVSADKYRARLIVNGQTVELEPGGRPGRIVWPSDKGVPSTVLKVFVNDNFTQDLSFDGQWGLMKLVDAGRADKINASTLNVKYQISVQNMYMVQQNCRFSIDGSDHPFFENPFRDFDCPTDLVLKKPGT